MHSGCVFLHLAQLFPITLGESKSLASRHTQEVFTVFGLQKSKYFHVHVSSTHTYHIRQHNYNLLCSCQAITKKRQTCK